MLVGGLLKEWVIGACQGQLSELGQVEFYSFERDLPDGAWTQVINLIISDLPEVLLNHLTLILQVVIQLLGQEQPESDAELTLVLGEWSLEHEVNIPLLRVLDHSNPLLGL